MVKKGELTDIYNFESPKFTLMIAFPQLMIQMIEIGCAKRQKMCQAEFCIFALLNIHREGGRGRRRARERKRKKKKRN